MSLTLLEDVRRAVMGDFKTVHLANYPTTKVNYPNLIVVDLEHQKDPFVSLYLDLSQIEKAALGDSELLVPGVLHVKFYFRENTGTAATCNYTDMLNAHLCMRQTGAIYYHEAKPRDIKTFPAWVGTLNYIKFDVNRSVTGS